MSTLASVIVRDTFANRPAASIAGRLFFDTTNVKMQRDNGSSWDDVAESAGSAPGNLWSMRLGSSQTLTQNTLTQILPDTTHIDGGGSVIDLANDRFAAPATGLYMVFATWLWEATAPTIDFYMSVKVGTTESIALLRGQPVTASIRSNGGHNGSGPLSLTSGDFVTLWIQPGNVAGVTARGNASAHLSTTFTLVRIT